MKKQEVHFLRLKNIKKLCCMRRCCIFNVMKMQIEQKAEKLFEVCGNILRICKENSDLGWNDRIWDEHLCD